MSTWYLLPLSSSSCVPPSGVIQQRTYHIGKLGAIAFTTQLVVDGNVGSNSKYISGLCHLFLLVLLNVILTWLILVHMILRQKSLTLHFQQFSVFLILIFRQINLLLSDSDQTSAQFSPLFPDFGASGTR